MSDPNGRAERIMALENKMAAVHADRVTSEDVHKANNPGSISDLKANAPGIDWQTYLAAAGLDKQPMFIVWQPGAIKGLSALVATEPLDSWKEWLAFHTINQYAAFLPQGITTSVSDFIKRLCKERQNSVIAGNGRLRV